MKKLSVCVLFGGISPEHEVSLRSAEAVLNNMDSQKYNILPLGITMLTLFLLKNKKMKATTVMGILILVGIVGGVTGILG